jgi:MOSC domain-containing protein
MDAAVPLGRLAGIWRYPVKSLAWEPLPTAEFDGRGMLGDRAAALFVTTPERPRSGKTLRGKEQPRFHTLADAAAAQRVADETALELEVRDEGPYFDAAPVSLVFDQWLDELEALCGMVCEPLRFRPNLFARALQPLPPEAGLSGVRLRIGSALLQVSRPIVRCVTPSYDLVTAESSQELLRTLVQKRNNLMGVYCTVESPGSVTLGDTLEVL